MLFWSCYSNFAEIFDVDHFISFLSNDVEIIKELPLKSMTPHSMRVPRKCTPKCYQNRVLPVLNKRHVSDVCRTVSRPPSIGSVFSFLSFIFC